MSTDTDVQPWDPQEGESAKAYEAFVAYRDQPADERSMLDVYRQVMGKPKARTLPGSWTAWSSKYRWTERAAAWDAEVARAHTREELAKKVEERRSWSGTLTSTSRLALSKIMQRLNDVDPAQLSIAEATRLLEVVDRVYRANYPESLPHLEPEPHERPLDRVRAMLTDRALEGDMEAIKALIALEERIAKADGTDAPERHLVGLEQTLAALTGGLALADLSPETRAQVVAELAPPEEIDGEEV